MKQSEDGSIDQIFGWLKQKAQRCDDVALMTLIEKKKIKLHSAVILRDYLDLKIFHLVCTQNFPKKLTFLTSWYLRVRIMG